MQLFPIYYPGKKARFFGYNQLFNKSFSIQFLSFPEYRNGHKEKFDGKVIVAKEPLTILKWRSVTFITGKIQIKLHCFQLFSKF